MPKPRKFSDARGRGECLRGADGEKIVDAAIDVYDDIDGADQLLAFAKWLTKAAKWLKEKEAAKT